MSGVVRWEGGGGGGGGGRKREGKRESRERGIEEVNRGLGGRERKSEEEIKTKKYIQEINKKKDK